MEAAQFVAVPEPATDLILHQHVKDEWSTEAMVAEEAAIGEATTAADERHFYCCLR